MKPRLSQPGPGQEVGGQTDPPPPPPAADETSCPRTLWEEASGADSACQENVWSLQFTEKRENLGFLRAPLLPHNKG